MCLERKQTKVYPICSDKFMTKSILESIGMKDTRICYDHFNLKLNLETELLCKWKSLHPTIKSMFRAPCDEILEVLSNKVINDCNGNTKCVSSLVKITGKIVIGHRLFLIMSKEHLGYAVVQGLNPTIAVSKKLYHRIWKVFMVLCNN